MEFTQIIELRTANIEEMQKLDEDYLEKLSPEERGVLFRRGHTVVDREDPEHFFTVLEYPSYEAMLATMASSTSHELSAAIVPLVIGEPSFCNGDVLHRETIGEPKVEDAFTQIIEVRTNDIEELWRLDAEYLEKLTEQERSVLFRRGQTVVDRDDPERFFTVLEYVSYEAMLATMETSTSKELSAAIAPLIIGEPRFYNCDVVHREVREA
jgi:quinol monooxygenase YgiN